jgi:PIN domain nuclease of toxin-antitoxin system
MRLLLDTHAFLWWVFDDVKLSQGARDLIADPAAEVVFRVVSAWEW